MFVKGLECCGGAELVGINDLSWTPQKYLLHYVDQFSLMVGGKGKGFIVVSYAFDVKNKGAGFRTRKQGEKRLKQWKKFIKDNGLGTMTFVRNKPHNPNYGKTVRLQPGLWMPNDEAIKKFVLEKKWRKGDAVFHNGVNW